MRVARNVSTAAVASIAAWSSWSHMVHVALRYGERPEVAYVLPISVDGMLVVASAAMVEDKRNGNRVRWSARIAFGAGVAASVAANIAGAQPTIGARIVAAWPAVAMLLVVEMLSRAKPSARSANTSSPDDDGDERSDQIAPTGLDESSVAPAQSASDSIATLGPPTADGLSADASHGNRRRRRSGPTADVVARMLAERPGARPADIAAEAGVTERHVRRLLTSRSPASSVTDSDQDDSTNT